MSKHCFNMVKTYNVVGFKPRSSEEVAEIESAARHASLDVASYVRSRVLTVARKENYRQRVNDLFLANQARHGYNAVSASAPHKEE